MEAKAAALLKERMAELPEDVRTAINASDLGERIRKVGEKHNLHIDQQGELGDETLLAMLGFSPLESLGVRLTQVLRLSPEEGEALAKDLGESIFTPIRESMKRFAAVKSAGAPTPETKPAATTLPTTTGPAVEAPKPAAPPAAMPKADTILAEKTIQKADPYREPV